MRCRVEHGMTIKTNRHPALDAGSVVSITQLHFVCHPECSANQIQHLKLYYFKVYFIFFRIRCRCKNGMTMKTNRHPALDAGSVASIAQLHFVCHSECSANEIQHL